MTIVTKEILKKISPKANNRIIDDLENYFDKYLLQYEINTKLRLAHFLAQCAHECDGFLVLEEYASGKAYEGRKDLGNVNKGDGVRYKGRGIIQITGRYNYRTYGKKLGIDLENNPTKASDPETSVLTALEYWKTKGLNKFADKDDIVTITYRINGGDNGLLERKKYLVLAKKNLPDVLNFDGVETTQTINTPIPTPTPPPAAFELNIIVAKRGDKSDYVKDLQEMLVRKGSKVSPDGDFGPGTENAVKAFQKNNGLPVTGSIDTNTLNKLMIG